MASAVASSSSAVLGATTGAPPSTSASFDIVKAYHSHLDSPSSPPMPIAAIFALCDLVSAVPSSTTTELISLVRTASSQLRSALSNPVPATAGLDLFSRLIVTMRWDPTVQDRRGQEEDFERQKQAIVELARHYAENTVPNCRDKIVRLSMSFIKDDAVIITHSYSRVVMKVLLAAADAGKRISVYVTESRPGGLGLRTHAELTRHNIPCTVLCDTAVAYVSAKVDLCLVGSEGVCESGGLLNAVGTMQMALVMKSAGKPVYAAAESFKLLRLFPLSQFDLPTSRPILPFPSLANVSDAASPAATPTASSSSIEPLTTPTASSTSNSTSTATGAAPLRMTPSMDSLNPAIDYTPPELVTLLFSDVGVLTPSGVADALLAVYGGGA